MFFHRKGQAVLAVMVAALLMLGLGQAAGLLRTEKRQSETQPQPTRAQENLVVGTVIRQETVIYAPETGAWRCLLDEGQRAAAGQALFIDGTAEELWEPPIQSPYGRHLALLAAVRDYQRPGSRGTELKALMTAEEENGAEFIETAQGAEQQRISAPVSGVFSRVTDGLEGVLTPEAPETGVADLPPEDRPAALGKLITSDTWYYYTRLPEAVKPGDILEARLLGGGFGNCRLRVEWAKKRGQGYDTLLSASTGVEAVSSVRRLWVKILSD